MELITKSIILRHAERTSDSEYVFPIITRTDPTKAYTQYQGALGYHNRKLKELGRLIGETIPLTHNVARNTWAKTAQNHDIPVLVIGSALGLRSEKATRDFLDSIHYLRSRPCQQRTTLHSQRRRFRAYEKVIVYLHHNLKNSGRALHGLFRCFLIHHSEHPCKVSIR